MAAPFPGPRPAPRRPANRQGFPDSSGQPAEAQAEAAWRRRLAARAAEDDIALTLVPHVNRPLSTPQGRAAEDEPGALQIVPLALGWLTLLALSIFTLGALAWAILAAVRAVLGTGE